MLWYEHIKVTDIVLNGLTALLIPGLQTTVLWVLTGRLVRIARGQALSHRERPETRIYLLVAASAGGAVLAAVLARLCLEPFLEARVYGPLFLWLFGIATGLSAIGVGDRDSELGLGVARVFLPLGGACGFFGALHAPAF